jgi:hypothetical protein
LLLFPAVVILETGLIQCRCLEVVIGFSPLICSEFPLWLSLFCLHELSVLIWKFFSPFKEEEYAAFRKNLRNFFSDG